jgi:hypothetical protein
MQAADLLMTDRPGQNKRLRYLWLGLRVAFVLLIFYFIGRTVDVGLLLRQVQTLAVGPLLAAILLTLFMQIMLSARWRLILMTQNRHVSLAAVLAYNLVGQFYSQFLPSSLSGDVVRAFYLGRAQDGKVVVYSSAFVDRIISLGVNGFISLIALLYAPDVLAMFNLSQEAALRILLILVVAGIVGVALLIIITRWQRQLPSILNRLKDILMNYSQHPLSMAAAVMLSAVYFLIWTASLFCLAQAVGLRDLPLPTLILILAAVNVAQFVPLSINGWGVREGTLISLLSLYQVPTEQAVLFSLLVAGMGLMLAVIGGGFVLLDYRYQPEKRND